MGSAGAAADLGAGLSHVAEAHRPILRNGQVFLRPLEREDLELAETWFADADVAEGFNARVPWSTTAQQRWFEESQEQQGTSAWFFVICLRVDGRPIGFTSLGSVDHPNGSAELFIAVGDGADRGRGLGTETMQTVLDFAFGELRLHRVFLRVFAYNTGAARLYERLGLTREVTMREALHRHGQYHDVHVMSLLRSEWAAQDRPRSWELD